MPRAPKATAARRQPRRAPTRAICLQATTRWKSLMARRGRPAPHRAAARFPRSPASGPSPARPSRYTLRSRSGADATGSREGADSGTNAETCGKKRASALNARCAKQSISRAACPASALPCASLPLGIERTKRTSDDPRAALRQTGADVIRAARTESATGWRFPPRAFDTRSNRRETQRRSAAIHTHDPCVPRYPTLLHQAQKRSCRIAAQPF